MKKDNKDPIIVYWAPAFTVDDPRDDWNILYSEPTQLYKKLNQTRDIKTEASQNMLSCPAVVARFRNTYIFKVENTTDLTIEKIENNNVIRINAPTSLKSEIIRGPSLQNNTMIKIAMSWFFFTEEDGLMMHINPPFLSNSKHQAYGTMVAGGFDISKWFRPVVAEINLWDNINEFVIERGEDFLYAEFITDRPVILKRFVPTDKVRSYAKECMEAANSIGRWMPLAEKYEIFKQAKMKQLILKEIKQNILGDNNEH